MCQTASPTEIYEVLRSSRVSHESPPAIGQVEHEWKMELQKRVVEAITKKREPDEEHEQDQQDQQQQHPQPPLGNKKLRSLSDTPENTVT